MVGLARVRALLQRKPKPKPKDQAKPDAPGVARGKSTILFVANCQHRPLRQITRMCIGAKEFDVQSLSHVELKEQPKKSAEVLGSADIVVTQALGESFGAFASAALKDRLRNRCVVVPNLFFYGYHPEITYSGSEAKRAVSPLGDYHSAAVILCHQHGLSAEETIRLLQDEEFFLRARLLEVADDSLNTLRQREKGCDVAISDYIAEHYRDSMLFYTVNHPSGVLMQELVLRVLARLEIPCRRLDPQIVRSALLDGPVYPVHDAYAALAGFAFRQPVFVKGLGGGGGSLSLDEFVRESFAMYSQHGGQLEVRSPYGTRIREYLASL